MISLKPLIQDPASPDRGIAQAYSQAESQHARFAHVNRLSRDIYDIKNYDVDFAGGTIKTIKIKSKKGILDVLNADATATSLYIWLENPEIEYDHDKFYIQLSVYCNNDDVTPIVIARGFNPDQFLIEVKNLDAAAPWSLCYVYYEIVKID